MARSRRTPLDEDRAHGVLLGLAVGNLLGLPVESAPRHVIRRAYPEGLSEIESAERYRALDDDLAQAVELAESLAQDDDLLIGFGDRLVRWRASNGRGIGYMTSTVIDGLEDGLGVPGAARAFWLDQGSPETQPNGGLMRCAPVAVQLARNPDALIERTAATCAVTHFAPGAQWSCVLVNAAIAMLLRGHTPSRDDLIGAAQEDGAPQELVEWARATPRTSDGITERIAGEEDNRPYVSLYAGRDLVARHRGRPGARPDQDCQRGRRHRHERRGRRSGAWRSSRSVGDT